MNVAGSTSTPSGAAPKDLLAFIAEGTAGTVGEEFFECLVTHLALAFESDVAFVAEVVPHDRDRARFLACWERGKPSDQPFEYAMAGTPCFELGESDVVAYPEGLRERFPDDEMVVDMGLESYLAVALRDSRGEHMGHLGVLAAAPLYPDGEKLAVLRIFAARAGGEIERRQHERALREREAMHKALADEQAALRRVATLVAAEAPEQELFDTVACEVGQLLDADVASLVRLDDDRFKIVAGWSRSGAGVAPVGVLAEVDGRSATGRALRTGEPARADGLEASADPILRELGIRSAVVAPIKVGGRVWGAVRAARTGDEPVAAGAEKRLGDFAELVAQAIANTQAREELAASRARIVEASDAERRRIERNLHDGAQQRLVTLSLSLRLAEKKLRGDPDAERLLAQAAEELALTLAELRELARGIHPAVLTDHGLAHAIDALAARAPLPVEVSATPAERLPEAIEATAYYVVAEALTNVAKYAEATAATVSVTATADVLAVIVTDDGIGGADASSGSGLRGLTDRVAAHRGTLRVTSPRGGGTVVEATIPVGAGARATPSG